MSVPKAIVVAHLALLLAVAGWFRICSFDTIPAQSADEAFYGIQAARIIRGQSFHWRTMSGNVADPFYYGMQAPLLLLSDPSAFVLRAPAVLSGLLSVALTFMLGARALGRAEARIAALFLAALPASVILSRIGCEFAQTPLVGIVVAYYAFRGRPLGLLLSFLASLLVHPTNIFLIPIFLPVFLTRQLFDHAGDRKAQGRIIAGTALTLALIVGPYSWLMLRNPAVQRFFGQERDWAQFFDGFGRFLFCLWLPADERAILWYRWLFRGSWSILLVLGLPRLVRARAWDRLASVVGLGAGLIAFHVLSTSIIFDSVDKKYGMVFLVPTALVFAGLLRAIVPEPDSQIHFLKRWAWVVPVLLVGWASIAALKVNFFDLFLKNGRDTIWALRSGDPYDMAFRIIREDLDGHERDGVAARLVLTQDVHNTMQFEYLASCQDRIKVAGVINLGDIWLKSVDPNGFEPKRRKLCELLELGAYAICDPDVKPEHGGGLVAETIRSRYPAGRVRRWDLPEHGGRSLTVYRLDPEPAPDLARRGAAPLR